MMKRFVAVAGNIGVGKSTLVRQLCEELGWAPVYEAVTENPYLEDFYADMQTWGFHSQVFFLGHRLEAHRRALRHRTPVLQDRSIYEDAEIFAANLFRQGRMSQRDYATYRDVYEGMIDLLPPPDLVIYLRANTETLGKRIRQRGRQYEMSGIDHDYLAQLNHLYEQWIGNFQLSPVLTVPADDIDFVAHPAHLKLIARKLIEKLHGREEVVFNPAEINIA